MQTTIPKTARTLHGGNTPTTSNTAEVRRVRTAPGELSEWQPVPQPVQRSAPAVVPVTVKPSKLAQVASTALNLPAWAGLSFIKTKQTRYGIECLDWLHVPAQTYSEGWVTGLRVMDELMALTKTHRNHGAEHALQSVIAAACTELEKPIAAGRSKRGAAQAVIHCMGRFMVAVDMVFTQGNRCLPVRQWLRHEIDYQTRMNADLAQEEADKRAEFVQRMKDARAAKRVQTIATAKGGHAHA